MLSKPSVYALYIFLSSLFTAGLNIIHTIYFLEIPLTLVSFIVPLFTGILFGYAFAHIKVLSEQLSEMAYTDALTHIYNRLHFSKFLDVEIDKIKRYGGTFSIIFIDLDHFKKVNDRFGHLIGDRVLRCVTDIITSANRSADIFARYGGEEFIILAPSTDLNGAYTHAERLRKDIQDYAFPIAGNITSSFGVAEFDLKTDNAESIVKRADKALYTAKKNGRNRVEKL